MEIAFIVLNIDYSCLACVKEMCKFRTYSVEACRLRKRQKGTVLSF